MAERIKAKVKTDVQVRAALSGSHSVGDGLILVVGKSGRSWVVRVQHGGQRRDVGLGSYPTVGLADARRKAANVRDRANLGSGPIKILAKACED